MISFPSENLRVNIRLFGPVQLNYEGQPPIHFRSNPQRALLTFLAMEAGRPSNRELIYGLIWPQLGESKARNNLRVTLSRLRRSLTGNMDIIQVSGKFIELNPQADIFVDARAFLALVETSRKHAHPPKRDCVECLDRYRQAAELIRGEFAEGLVLDQNIPFMEWLILKREWMHREALALLHTLADYHLRRGELHQAQTYSHRQLELEPWREEAHRQLMAIFARGDQKSAALAQYEKCKQVLEDELGVEPSAETQSLYERIRNVRQRKTSKFSSTLTPFIGREFELAQVIGTLADPACHQLTLIGPGGIGKTRLALQAAKHQAGAFLDGVVFIPLVGVGAPEFLVSAMTDALALSSQGQGDLKKQLLDFLREKEMLLVLDNFEHLLEGAALLGDILHSAPETKMIVTSRARLNLSWEWLFEMDGLRCPKGEGDDAIESYGAVQLFVQSARRVERNFSLLHEKEHVVRTCQLLDGMPLGIELAAARVREFSCREIVEHIQQNLDFLATSMRDVSPRHRSLRAAFEHSWNLLSEEERRVFQKLSVFPANFDRVAARAITGASLDMLSSFVDKSLLRRTHPTENATPVRYDLHELICQFADEKLAEAPKDGDFSDKEILQELHSKYYASFLHEREKYMRTEKMHIVLLEVRHEIENVRAAWHWAVEHNSVKETRKFFYVMLCFYEIQGWFWEAEKAYAMTVESLHRLVEAADEPDSETSLGLGWALFYQGWYAMRISQYEKAEALTQRGMDIAHKVGDRDLETLCLDGLGVTAKLKGEYTIATKYLKKCYEICKETGNEWLAGGALANLGDIAMMQGEYEEAHRLVQESLATHKRDGDKWGIATRTTLLGEIAARKGEYTLAEALLKESLVVYEEIGQQWRMADSFNSLAKLASRREDYADAQAYYQESLSRVRETGDRDRIGLTLALLGETSLALGHKKVARRQFQEALEIAVQIQADPLTLRALLGMASLLAHEEKMEKAIELLACVIHHPAVEQTVNERAEKLLHRLEAELGPEVMTAAFNRRKERKIATHMEALIP